MVTFLISYIVYHSVVYVSTNKLILAYGSFIHLMSLSVLIRVCISLNANYDFDCFVFVPKPNFILIFSHSQMHLIDCVCLWYLWQICHSNIAQQQNTIISESSKLSFYREFYEFGKRASYVDELTNRNDRSHLAKLRPSDHSLEHWKG
jgi:hypothetical protein